MSHIFVAGPNYQAVGFISVVRYAITMHACVTSHRKIENETKVLSKDEMHRCLEKVGAEHAQITHYLGNLAGGYRNFQVLQNLTYL